MYNDSSCLDLVETEEYEGSYVLGDLVEISSELHAREIAETFDPMTEGIGTITWHAYYFISENTLYFGADRGEEGEEPNLIIEKPYFLVAE